MVTLEQEEEPTEEEEGQQPEVRFNLSREWVTNETQLMKRCEYLQSAIVDLSRKTMEIITYGELIQEGIEELQRTRPTYEFLVQKKEEEAK